MLPFQKQVTVTLPAGTDGENGNVTVPDGQRLVIEFVSAMGEVPVGQDLLFGVICNAGGEQAWHTLDCESYKAKGSRQCFFSANPVHLYADPGSNISLRVDRHGSEGECKTRMTLSGYLEKAH